MTKTALQLHWNLDDLVTAADFDKLLKSITHDITQYDKWFAKMTPTMSTEVFRQYIDFSSAATDRMARAYYRPGLLETLDETDEEAKVLKNRVQDLGLKSAEASRKIGLWLKGLPVGDKPLLDDKNAKRLFKSYPVLEYNLNYSRAAARYTLTEREEDITSNKDASGVGTLVNLRDLINAEAEFTLKLPGQKPKIIKNEEEVRVLVYHPEARYREAAYRALFDYYERNASKYFMIYQGVVKDWGYEARLRGYKSPIAMRNFGNHIPDRAIEVLMEVCEANTSVFQDYFRFKAQALGMKKLSRFDIYAPLESTQGQVPLAEAVDIVLKTFEEFSPQFASYARRIIDDQHVDSEPAEHKRSGAFCATPTADLAPYVMLNYTKSLRDVSTIAHELGHGVHSLYASHLPSAVQQANLPLAETASTFAEMILFEKLLDQTKSDDERRAMLSDKMSDSYATICRQSFFIKAEMEAHRRMGDGLTPTDMSEIWMDTLKTQFGDAVEIDPMFGYEWAYIPHIVHTPFYCYAYNFGELLSLALFAQYKQEGASFVPKIEAILAAGGSQDPQKVLKEVGIDMTSADFWQGSFAIIENWMKQLKSL